MGQTIRNFSAFSMKKIAFVTLFPDWIRESLGHSMMARAEASGAVEFSVVNPRNFCYESHRKADDVPYGGHPGMLMKAEPVALAIESILGKRNTSSDQNDFSFCKTDPGGITDGSQGVAGSLSPSENESETPGRTAFVISPRSLQGSSEENLPGERPRLLQPPPQTSNTPRTAIVITEPSGTKFEQPQAKDLSQFDQIIFVCGHYEGIDHRIEETFATHVFSIGDYVLTNGELPALVMADAVVRLLPGVLGNEDSLEEESFQNNLLGAPNYTRPEVWRDNPIPDVLKSGNHALIEKWRKEQAQKRTKERRPDLLD
jgi:tRNA (guanine37-N1)-methyltransferase